jgi:phage tail sheath protein FI
MAFRVSPGVSIKEIDLTTIIPAVATTPGGFAGYFQWGPTKTIVPITNQTELVNTFGKPVDSNYVDFFTAGNFLDYGNNCQTVRVVGTASFNSYAVVAGGTIAVGATTAAHPDTFQTLTINNENEFYAAVNAGGSGASNINTAAAQKVLFAAKYRGTLGNALKVVVTSGPGTTGASLGYAASLGDSFLYVYAGSSTDRKYFAVGDTIEFVDGTNVSVSGLAKIPGGTTVAFASIPWTTVTPVNGDFFGVTSGWSGPASAFSGANGITAAWRLTLSAPISANQSAGASFTHKSVYASAVSDQSSTTAYAADRGGTGDLINILVFDEDGTWTGTSNTLLEKFEGLSRASDARKSDGSANYYKTVINEQSRYIWAIAADVNDNTGGVATKTDWTLIGPPLSTTSAVGSQVNSIALAGGALAAPTDSERWNDGWKYFADADTVDVSLLPMGNASNTLAQLVVQNVCEKRLDCIAFVSPRQTDVEFKTPQQALVNIKGYRDNTLNINTSYAVIDSGWKYQLDTYNNVIRVMPLNPDIAGLVARTEFTNEAWFSPAGFNRGQIKNVVRLAYNPTQEAHRDELYTRQVNPVVSFPGEGVILFGDKTAQTRPSAFDRINVRRLFIVLEKAIATASKFFLFEQNDAFTRAQFRSLVVPFLKTIQERRGITDFKVVCDETNNTGEVIDRNEFVADIFIKPTRSVNFISLNFVATKTGVNFSEVGG